MDRRLIRNVENNYPYPLAIEFRRLNTPDIMKPDYKRLKQILKTSEKTIHFLTLIALSDLLDKALAGAIEIPDGFRKEFITRFTRTTFGKWIGLLRDTIKIFIDNDQQLYIEEFADYFFKRGKKEAPAQAAFNQLVRVRNSLEHPNFNPTPHVFKDLCEETESYLETVFKELDFIADYQFLYVHNVSVLYHRFHEPGYSSTLAEVVGLTNEFSSYVQESDILLNSPAVIVNLEEKDHSLSLDPLVLYSDEGGDRITDIFLYTDWDPRKNKIKYLPADKGGEFDLGSSSIVNIYGNNLFKFFESFALPDELDSLGSSLEALST